MESIGLSSWLRRGSTVALACLAGCSLALTGPDEKLPKHKSPDCDRTKGLVALDGLMAGLGGLTGLALLSDNESAAAAPLVIGALYTLAAVYGNNTVNDCRAAIAKYEDNHRVDGIAGAPEKASLPGRAKRAELKKRIDEQVPSEPQGGPPDELPLPPDEKVAPPPVTAKPAPPAIPVKPPPPPPPQQAGDPWRDFWREVP